MEYKMGYLNNFNFCKDNDDINEVILDYIDYVLRTDEFRANIYLCKLKEVYGYNNFMYILECISNYIIKVYNMTYIDYKYSREYNNFKILNRLRSRYNNIMSIYYYNLEKRSSYSFNNYSKKFVKYLEKN